MGNLGVGCVCSYLENGVLIHLRIIQALLNSARLLALGQREGQRLLLLIPEDGYTCRVVGTRAQRVAEVTAVVYRLSIDLHDNVAGAEPRLFGAAPFLY